VAAADARWIVVLVRAEEAANASHPARGPARSVGIVRGESTQAADALRRSVHWMVKGGRGGVMIGSPMLRCGKIAF